MDLFFSILLLLVYLSISEPARDLPFKVPGHRLTPTPSTKPIPNPNSMIFVDKINRLDTYLSVIAKKAGREFMFLNVYYGIITTEGGESVIHRTDRKIRCVGRDSILELGTGERRCVGGYFVHQSFNIKTVCGPGVPHSSIFFDGALMHCVGSSKVDIIFGKIKCEGLVFSDEEMALRCPLSGKVRVHPSTWLEQAGQYGLNQWGNLGPYNLGYVGCDSGLTVSFVEEEQRFYCMGEGVHVVSSGGGFQQRCNDRQLTTIDYRQMCGNNGNMPNEFERPAIISGDVNDICNAKLIAVRLFNNNKLLGYCVGQTILISLSPTDAFFCHGGISVPLNVGIISCEQGPTETYYVKSWTSE